MNDLKVSISQKQKLNIGHNLIQSIDLLQMTTQELSELIIHEAEVNPFIDMDTLYSEGSPVNFREKVEWLNRHRLKDRCGTTVSAQDDDKNDTSGTDFTADFQESLKWVLLSQLTAQETTGENFKIYEFLIECIDAKGYLDIDPYETSSLLNVEQSTVEHCLMRLRGLQPAGICSKNLRTCLLTQITNIPDGGTARAIIDSYLDELAKGHFSLIAKKLHVSLSEVHQACGMIKKLSPIPVSGICKEKKAAEYLLPDAFVTFENGKVEVSLYQSYVPYLTINPYYLELYHQTNDNDVKEYLEEKLRATELLLKNIKQRETTFLKCIRIISDIQFKYFSDNSGILIPMTLDDVALRAGVHISTVSRAIRGKYIQSIHGIVEIRKLFSRRIDSPQEVNCSADMAKKLIASFIENESAAAPLSDQQITDMLAVKGVMLSRRTVTKYREQLGLPSTLSRKSRDAD